ncbi:hypothetical protein M422DRAFT_780256 [Sphaerobolus stellatus SS14]|uniref:Unplaced genomic scaffold SPHSTscaffold_61, whole genome shotgun sequence n=1 Tax=Sphaerobolus stellatus (strain SS14) TaxID=990650 RepID=A0A0C9VSP8_SPHS4|nr:hypothetical protein M422DRAFT_780256 [Sphaerobolus stellatus SS14]
MPLTPQPPALPGSAVISGIASIFHVEQLSLSRSYKIIRATAEFPIGLDENGCCYYLFGKISIIQASTELPDNIECDMLDFQVDVWSLSKLEGKKCPVIPFISVSGCASNCRDKERTFDLGVKSNGPTRRHISYHISASTLLHPM